LTIASADREYFDHVEMDLLHRQLDWINVMAYDFYNSLTPTTGHHAGLYRAVTAPESSRWADASVQQHLAAGVPAHKLVLGVAFYGRRFEGVKPGELGATSPTIGMAVTTPLLSCLQTTWTALATRVTGMRLRSRPGYGTRTRAAS
jgi:GH18 family chitinase